MSTSESFSKIKAPKQPQKDIKEGSSGDVNELTIPGKSKPTHVKFTTDDLTDAEVKRHYLDTVLRETYSFKAFKVVKKSLWGWAILLFIYGLVKFLTRHDNGGFEIFSDHVLIAITTATTLNIFAGFLSLIRGLFPSIKEDSKAKQLSPSVQVYCKTPKKNTY
ncbi:hypothetical protein [Snodgrassella communis]|uniref:hypothetical protein n=1 Tax=Snodgrassella communis TaxID=2946699 RepID=UPI00286CB654|nr:hypothetical protein [Snodgrassella communis]WMY91918.1 hypothetical protein PYG29_00580 [Snodgrassella communis]